MTAVVLYQISPKANPLRNALTFQRVALGPRGARAVECKNPLAEGAIPLLDPAGPAAAAFESEQPLGAVAAPCPGSPRRCRPIDDDQWRAVVADVPYAEHLGVLVGEDNLLLSMLRTEGPVRVLELIESARARCARLSVFFTASEDVPGGFDLHDGRAFSRTLVGAGAAVLVVTSGSLRLPALMTRARDEVQERRAQNFCKAARWMAPADVPLLAWTKGVPPDIAQKTAADLGLDGVCIEDFSREGS